MSLKKQIGRFGVLSLLYPDYISSTTPIVCCRAAGTGQFQIKIPKTT